VALAIIPYPALPSVITPRTRRTIELIMLHSTGGRKPGDLFTLSGNDATHPVSCHYYVTKEGDVYQLVQDKDVAWHAGVCRTWNGKNVGNVSLGIELENLNRNGDPYPEVQLAAAVALLRAKLTEHRLGIDRVIRHADYALPAGRRTDPVGLDWPAFLTRVSLASNPDLRRYVVGPNVAVIRQAKTRDSIEVARLAPATEVWVKAVVFGQMIDGSDEWLHTGDERGFVHSKAVVRV
jgi:N-acetyl-anhydromuramyl-L-alanine amidase AmpD